MTMREAAEKWKKLDIIEQRNYEPLVKEDEERYNLEKEKRDRKFASYQRKKKRVEKRLKIYRKALELAGKELHQLRVLSSRCSINKVGIYEQ